MVILIVSATTVMNKRIQDGSVYPGRTTTRRRGSVRHGISLPTAYPCHGISLPTAYPCRRLTSTGSRSIHRTIDTGFEFVDQLAAHLPPRRAELVRRYAVYAGKVRTQWSRRPGIHRLAAESWKPAHPVTQQDGEPAPPEEDLAVPDAWAKLRKQSRARLLQKVYEVDPFICPKCQGIMTAVALIQDPADLAKIISWAKTQAIVTSSRERAPPSLALVTE